MRRIVHYYPAAMGHSGVSFALWSWARAQAAAGFDVRIMHAPSNFTGAGISFVPKDACSGVSAAPIPHRGHHRLTLSPLALERHLDRNDLLVLHEGWVMSNVIAARAARRLGVPYLVMPHGVYEPAWTKYLKPPRWIRHRVERQLLEGAAAVHVFFASEIDDIRRLAPRANFLVVPTGFDLPSERWTGGGDYLAWIGRIDPVHKGLDLLIGAIARLLPADRPTLRIRGYDYNGGVAALRRLIAERKVAPWVRLEGPAAGIEKTSFLQRADGYIHPSRWECHSIALLENLALGAPCLVSDAVHIADTLRRSDAAVLSSPTECGFAMMLPRLREATSRIAAQGRHLIAEAFNWNVLMPQFRSSLTLLGLQ